MSSFLWLGVDYLESRRMLGADICGAIASWLAAHLSRRAHVSLWAKAQAITLTYRQSVILDHPDPAADDGSKAVKSSESL
jgi:hypothetical protein